MKFSETEGTDISNKSKLQYIFVAVFLFSIFQSATASDLHMFSNDVGVVVVTSLDGQENLFFNGLLENGLLEAIQTISKSNSDGTGGSGTESNSDGTGGIESNSDGTGSPNLSLTVVLDCDSNGLYQANGLIESESKTETAQFQNVYLDGMLIECNDNLNVETYN